jgi:hypothetical protein
MSRISGKINLMNLVATRKILTGQNGPTECLVIPIEKNKLFVGDKGVYLDLIAFEIDPEKRNTDSRDSHLLKQSFSKEIREKMSENELKSFPILGNLQVWGEKTEAEAVSDMTVQDEKSDLPF